ncbi:MAG: porin family protein [Xanthomonadales bacterium]|nr:porin family protein [Xanthomonadales bacterium]NNK33885.1 porin family protein [Xanthomonadales bacterium]
MKLQRLLFLIALLALSTTVHAQRFNQKQIHDGIRYKNFEVSLLVQGQQGISEDFEGGSTLDIDDEFGWGFSIGWNWTEKWNLAYQFSLVKPKYSATLVPEDPMDVPRTIDFTMSKYAHQFNATYHFLSGPITPYIQAGAGWTKLDSNIIDRPPITGCWWDPWWGYICTTTWTTYDTTEFSWNAGLGLRWDVNGALFLRGSYNREFVKVDSGSLDFDTISLHFGLMW